MDPAWLGIVGAPEEREFWSECGRRSGRGDERGEEGVGEGDDEERGGWGELGV